MPLGLDRLGHAASNPLDPKDYNEDIRTDHDIDPDVNFLLSQTLSDKCQYYYEDSFNNLISQEGIKNELSLIHFNMRSIKNKHGELCHYFNSLKINFSIIGKTETSITDNDPNIFNIQGYNFIIASRKSKTCGGVGLYCILPKTLSSRNVMI